MQAASPQALPQGEAADRHRESVDRGLSKRIETLETTQRGLIELVSRLVESRVPYASGHDLLAGLAFPWPLADVARHHHERIDGSGYPDALAGEAIGIEARIVGVADVVESMASPRPYRPGLLRPVADRAPRPLR